VSSGTDLSFTNISGVNASIINFTGSTGYFRNLNLYNNSNIAVTLSVSTQSTGNWNLVLPSNSGSQYQYLQNFGPNFTTWSYGSSKVLVFGNRIKGLTSNTLSTAMIERAQVFVGSVYLSGNPNSDNLWWDTFTVPTGYTGYYIFDFGGWRCGEGNGTCQLTIERNSSIVYDQKRIVSYVDCSIFNTKFFWNNLASGDKVTFKVNENSTGSQPASITDASTDQTSSAIIITWWNQYN
jgi:hypothetical protein